MPILLILRMVVAFVALLLPGLAFWAWFQDKEDDPAQSLAQILGFSFSVIALGALLFFVLGIQLKAWIIAIILALCVGFAIFGFIKNKPKLKWQHWVMMLLILGGFITWRLWQARELVLPNWVDSQHHVLIVRKFIEGGGLPASLEPYLPGPFYYHFSFHSVAAFFASISGQNPAQATLLLGQVLNALIGLGIYTLTKALSKDWRPALVAALFVTFVTKMPGYYLTWGRYTLLTGTFLLALAMAFAQKIHEGKTDPSNTISLTLLTTGALLSHYLIAFLLALYLLILGIDWIICSLKTREWSFKNLLSLVFPAVGGLVLSLPWYLRVLRYSADRYSLGVDTSSAKFLLKAEDWDYVKYVLGPVSGYLLIALALIALVFAFIKSSYRTLAVWSLVILFMTLPTGIQFMSFRGDYFALITFIPITILSALGLYWLAEILPLKKNKTKIVNFSLAIIVGAISIWGFSQTKRAINRVTVLATKDDVEAMDWINENLPKNARFYVNTVYWGYNISRGIDGGGWLLPYTGRFSLAPTTFFPYGMSTEENKVWMDWGQRASQITSCDDAFYDLLADADLEYIYIRDGVKPNGQKEPAGIQKQTLSTCPGLTLLYENNSVSIWKLD